MGRRKTVTLSVDATLYEMLKLRKTLSPSKVFDLALQALLSENGDISEKVMQKMILQHTKEIIEVKIREIEDSLKRLEFEKKSAERTLKEIEDQLKNVERELRLERLEKLIQKLQRIVRMYEMNVEEILNDEDGRAIVEEIKELRPDFDIEKFVARMVKYGYGV